MSEFHIFANVIEARFKALSQDELFMTNVGGDNLWDYYLSSFPAGSNPIFRVRTEHDCSCCRNFIRNVGGVISISNGTRTTLWSVEGLPEPYATVAKRLDEIVRSSKIEGIYRTKESRYGNELTRELKPDDSIMTWNHFFCRVEKEHKTPEPDKVKGEIRTTFEVFKRGLDELKFEAMQDVMELIETNSLYRGQEHRESLEGFSRLWNAYPRDEHRQERYDWIWRNCKSKFARFRSSVIGTLVTDLSDGMELEEAVRKFEKKVAPENYKRTSSLITPKMIEGALATLDKLGLRDSINRRYAKLSDVSVNNVLFVDSSARGQMKDVLSSLLLEETKPRPVISGQRPLEIKVDDFLREVVPQAQSMDLLVENKHQGNFMSLTTEALPGSGNLFKWPNPFAWSYDGDFADGIKAKVKKAGGKVEADVRVSLGWFNFDDLDLHCIEPGGNHVYYGNKERCLDVDMNAGGGTSREPVENMVWDKPKDGVYQVFVHNYAKREVIDVGFDLEFETDGKLFPFVYKKPLSQGERVECFAFEIRHGKFLDLRIAAVGIGQSTREKWGIETEKLVPIDTLLASPNHWDDRAIGNKHWFFILKGCKNPEGVRGIYNEFLRGDLEPHRKVFEILGAKTKAPFAEEQLSGIGFSSTRHDDATIVVKGASGTRAYNVIF